MTQRTALILVVALVGACSESPTSPETLANASSSRSAMASGGGSAAVTGEVLYGLTADNEIVTFGAGKVNQTTSVVQITGLAAGETVVGIDFRPSDTGANGINEIGQLYAVTSASRLYMVDPVTGIASSPVTLSIAIDGSVTGVGFNPAADRLRIHTATNQNLRINVETGATILDGPLTYTAGDVNAGADPDLVATAYTNNDSDPTTGTALFAIDAAQDVLVGFGPAVAGSGPNSGFLLTIGALGVDAGSSAGFDISNSSGIAYAVLGTSASGKSVLYTINLTTGTATKVGMLAQTKGALIGLAVRP